MHTSFHSSYFVFGTKRSCHCDCQNTILHNKPIKTIVQVNNNFTHSSLSANTKVAQNLKAFIYVSWGDRHDGGRMIGKFAKLHIHNPYDGEMKILNSHWLLKLFVYAKQVWSVTGRNCYWVLLYITTLRYFIHWSLFKSLRLEDFVNKNGYYNDLKHISFVLLYCLWLLCCMIMFCVLH